MENENTTSCFNSLMYLSPDFLYRLAFTNPIDSDNSYLSRCGLSLESSPRNLSWRP